MVQTVPTRPFALLATAFALTVPGVASAQTAASASPRAISFAKSEAILGGQPSALAAILARQSGHPAPAATAATLIRPAAYSRPTLTSAVLRRPVLAAPAVESGRPDLFGSVALRISRTPLDARWNRVEHRGVGGAAALYAAALKNSDALDRVEAVNRYVNSRVEFVDDSRQYGRADVWTSASETLARGRGDCEDYAIAKMQMLRKAGFADRDLYLVIVRDLVRRSDHAVLVVRSEGRMLMLDNGSDRVVDADSVEDYRPILTFAASSGSWTHGYRRDLPKIEYASASPAPLAPAADTAQDSADGATDQRSRSASLLALSTGFNR